MGFEEKEYDPYAEGYIVKEYTQEEDGQLLPPVPTLIRKGDATVKYLAERDSHAAKRQTSNVDEARAGHVAKRQKPNVDKAQIVLSYSTRNSAGSTAGEAFMWKLATRLVTSIVLLLLQLMIGVTG